MGKKFSMSVYVMCVCLSILLGYFLGTSNYVPIIRVQAVDAVSFVSCDSDSMSPALGCHDKLYLKKLKYYETVWPGKTYIFNTPYDDNGTVVHRLMGCVDKKCTQLIFKGDRNRVADPLINRSDVLYEVVGVTFE